MLHQFDAQIDKTVFAVVDSFQEQEAADRAYWLSKSPVERLAALELLRQINYGYDLATARLPRSLEILQRGED